LGYIADHSGPVKRGFLSFSPGPFAGTFSLLRTGQSLTASASLLRFPVQNHTISVQRQFF
jgi:hypothetical protein